MRGEKDARKAKEERERVNVLMLAEVLWEPNAQDITSAYSTLAFDIRFFLTIMFNFIQFSHAAFLCTHFQVRSFVH